MKKSYRKKTGIRKYVYRREYLYQGNKQIENKKIFCEILKNPTLTDS